MSNSIWKTGDPTYNPDRYGDYYVQEYHREDDSKFYVVGDCSELNDRWAYLTDIIAQADKAERLQKAVDLAVDALKDIQMTYVVHYDNGAIRFRDAKDIAVKAKKEIKQLIKEQ